MKRPLAEVMAHFDHLAPSSEEWGEPMSDRWHRATMGTVIDRAELERTDVVLDLGCGTGRLARAIAGHVGKVVALDCSPGMLAMARIHPEAVTWVLGDMRDAPPVDRVDAVTMCHAVRYLDTAERRALFAALAGRLVPGGIVVIGDLLWSLPRGEVDDVDGWLDDDWAYAVTADEVVEELQASGFRTFKEVLHPAIAVVRGVPSRSRA